MHACSALVPRFMSSSACSNQCLKTKYLANFSQFTFGFLTGDCIEATLSSLEAVSSYVHENILTIHDQNAYSTVSLLSVLSAAC